MARQKKISVKVEIPEKLASFLSDVARKISEQDVDVTVESDDLLQCDVAYGGLGDSKNRVFGFTYFADDEQTWDFVLTADDIFRIARGESQTLELWKCSNSTCQCLHAAEDAYCSNCDSISDFEDYPKQLRIHYPDADDATIAAMGKLRKISLALLDYSRDHDGTFPPAYTSDAAGQKLHSWRALVLPYLGFERLSDQIDFTVPWNSPANRQVAEESPEVYVDDANANGMTSVTAVLGEDTMWPAAGQRRLMDITSGDSYTFAAVKLLTFSKHWMEPVDESLDSLIGTFDALGIELLAAFVDGHVERLDSIDVDRFREFATIR